MGKNIGGSKFDFEMYRYTPSLIGAIVALTVFSGLAALHAWQLYKTKPRQLIILWIVVGAIGKYISQLMLPAQRTNICSLNFD